MLDSDLTAVLRRRLVAFAIDAGLVSLITALVARSQFEKFPVDPAAWSTQQFDRLVELNDSFHRMQEVGDDQFVIDGPGMLITTVIGLILATIIFVLVPAIAGWSPGKKLTGLRVASLDESRVGVGQLVTRTAALVVDLFPFVIPGLVGFMMAGVDSHRRRFGDRIAKTTVIDAKKHSAAPSAPEAPSSAPQRPQSSQERTAASKQDSSKPEPALSQSMRPETALPDAPAVATRPTTASVMPEPVEPEPPASLAGPQTAPSDVPGSEEAEMQREKIDVTEFLDPEPEAPSTSDLIEATGVPDGVAPDEPLLLSEPLPGNMFTVAQDPKTSAGLSDEPQAAVPPPALAGPEAQSRLDPKIDFDIDAEPKTVPERNDSVFGASSAPQREQQPAAQADPANQDAVDQDAVDRDAASAGEDFPPPPIHRETGWEPPRAEPAPVWRPSDEPDARATAGTPAAEASEPALESAANPTQPTTSEQAEAAAQASPADDGPDNDGPTDPVWSDDWQAWLYWDDKRRRWLRHDIENNRWVPIS